MPKKNAKHAAAPTSGKKLTKAAFVRSLPDTMPAKDVVAQGVAAGLEFSEKYVYNTRSSARVKPAARAAAPRAAAVKAASACAPSQTAASVHSGPNMTWPLTSACCQRGCRPCSARLAGSAL